MVVRGRLGEAELRRRLAQRQRPVAQALQQPQPLLVAERLVDARELGRRAGLRLLGAAARSGSRRSSRPCAPRGSPRAASTSWGRRRACGSRARACTGSRASPARRAAPASASARAPASPRRRARPPRATPARAAAKTCSCQRGSSVEQPRLHLLAAELEQRAVDGRASPTNSASDREELLARLRVAARRALDHVRRRG